MTLLLRANCYEFVLTALIVTLLLVGFYNYAKMIVDTPNGDFTLLMIIGGLGWHFKLN